MKKILLRITGFILYLIFIWRAIKIFNISTIAWAWVIFLIGGLILFGMELLLDKIEKNDKEKKA